MRFVQFLFFKHTLWQIEEKDMGILRRNTIRRRIAAFPVKNMR